MTLLPFFFYITLLFCLYSVLRNYNQPALLSIIYSYILGNLFLTTLAKIILIFDFILYSKIFFFGLLFILIIVTIKFKKKIYEDLRTINLQKNLLTFFFFLIVFYIVVQSLILPPANFDSLAYHIQRNYLFINENTIYPINNAHYSNQVFQPLNHDLFFYFFAVFRSNIFMNIYSIVSFLIIVILLKLIFDKIKIQNQKTLFFIFLAFSSITLSMLTTKNDLVVCTYALICLYLLYEYIQNVKKLFLIFFIITASFAVGIKWTFVFFLISIFPFFIFFILKKKLFLQFTRIIFYLLPILIFSLPTEILYFNYLNVGNPLGPEYYLQGNENPDGLKGAISNFIRTVVTLFDITLPVHYFGIDYFNNFFDRLVKSCLLFLFKIENLGISNNIKWLEYSYEYTLKPHSDYTSFSLAGFFVTLISFLYLLFGKENILKITSLISFIYMLLIISYLTWQPWIMRFFMLCMVLNLIVSSKFISQLPHKVLFAIRFFSIIIFTFNLLTNIPQPLIAHSNTKSWLNAFGNRDDYGKFSIPEIKKINNYKKLIKPNTNVALIILKPGSQSPYEIIRQSRNNYFIFVDENLKNYFQAKYFDKKVNIYNKNIDYIINLTDQNLEFFNFKLIQTQDENNYQIFKREKL